MNITKPSLNPDKPELPPALVEDIHDDPAAFAPAARVMAITMIHEQYCDRELLTPTQKKDLAEMLMKVGRIDGKAQEAQTSAGAGYQLVINIGANQQETFKGVTVEATPVKVEDATV